MEAIKDRLLTFLKSKGISKATFERNCGLSNGYMRNLARTPGVDKLNSIFSAYPELSPQWLLHGEGDMTQLSFDLQTLSGDETIKDRLRLFINQKQITTKAFEQICGMSNGYVASMRKGFGSEKLNNILSAFPELSRDWLLFGEGPMTIQASAQSPPTSQDTLISELQKEVESLRETNARLLKIIENLSKK